MTGRTDPRGRRRIAAALALAAVIAAGLGVHALPDGSPATDVAGDALYAVAAFALAVLVAPRAPSLLAGAVAAVWCTGVELLQLTGIPAALATTFRPVALVLGTGFDARDLVVYVAAIAAAVAIDSAARRATRAG